MKVVTYYEWWERKIHRIVPYEPARNISFRTEEEAMKWIEDNIEGYYAITDLTLLKFTDFFAEDDND